jgi:mono/diheme cytochrome c family protein
MKPNAACRLLVAALLLTGCVVAAPPAAPPAPPPETQAARGAMIALDVCARCHQVRPDRPPALEAAAPSFMEIANLPGRNRDYLRGFATRRHEIRTLGAPRPVMPTFFLTPEDREEVVAYLLSWRRPDAPDGEAPEPLEAFE